MRKVGLEPFLVGRGSCPPHTHTRAHALSSLFVASLGERPQLSLKQFAG